MTPAQEQKLNEVHAAIIGNPQLGQPGIIPRLEVLEAYKEKDKALKLKVAGGLFIATPLFAFVASWIRHKLGFE